MTVQAAEGSSTSSDIPTAPNHLDRPHFEPCSPTKRLPDDSAPNEDKPAIRSARQTLVTAIITRITQHVRLQVQESTAETQELGLILEWM
jgi:hypothetical protein